MSLDILGFIVALRSKLATISIRQGQLVYGFANAGIAGKIVMTEDKASWHQPWPEPL
jgi:hypothetical protein